MMNIDIFFFFFSLNFICIINIQTNKNYYYVQEYQQDES